MNNYKSKEYLSLMTNLLRNLAFCAAIDAQSERLQVLVKTFSFESIQTIVQNVFKESDEQFVQATLDELDKSASAEKVRLMCLEIMICRNVEVFDYYISQMLRIIFTQRPEILKASDHSILMSEVLQCTDITEIIQRVSEKKIQELSYKGLSDIIKYLNSSLKLGFDEKIPQYQDALEVFQARNIIVHNSSIINEVYLQKTNRKDIKIGEKYPLTENYFVRATGSLVVFGARLDEKFVSHFRLNVY